MSALTLKVHPSDTLIIALQDLATGQMVEQDGEAYQMTEDVPAKHKFAARAFAFGEQTTMYGVTVGTARRAIARGERIHTENIVHAAAEAVVSDREYLWNPPSIERWKEATFMGYHRTNGGVGTANYWIVAPLVFCENRNLAFMKEALLEPLGYAKEEPYSAFVNELVSAHRNGSPLDDVLGIDETNPVSNRSRLFPNVDGIKFLSHTLGCGTVDQDTNGLAGLLAGYVTHPNVAGATILSLGCQKAQIDHLKTEIERRDPGCSKPVFYFEQQKSRSEKDMLSRAIRATFKGVALANDCIRSPAPISKLTLGVECGGSDGFSGLSSNPVIGGVSDRVAASGGSVILSEFPELCGVEQNLVDRCRNPELAERFLELMATYSAAAERVGSGFDHNPAPGNIADGLTTDAIKSAGAARKGGSAPVSGVLDYPEQVTASGLNLLCTPGSDVESTTAMAGAGANLILFSTGLGTPTGNPIAPVLKVSSNTVTARKFPDLIDFDAGSIIDGAVGLDELSEKLLELVARTASGDYQTRADRLGQNDFIPWKRGVSL